MLNQTECFANDDDDTKWQWRWWLWWANDSKLQQITWQWQCWGNHSKWQMTENHSKWQIMTMMLTKANDSKWKKLPVWYPWNAKGMLNQTDSFAKDDVVNDDEKMRTDSKW